MQNSETRSLISKQLHKSTQNGFKDLKVRPETVKPLDENAREMLHDIVTAQDILDKTPKAQESKTKMDRQDYIKLKSFYSTNETNHQSEEIAYRMGENICKLYI